MGIPGLFLHILQKYNSYNIIQPVTSLDTDFLLFDYNSFMHFLVNKYIFEHKNKKKIIKKNIDQKIINYIIKQTIYIVTKIVKPKSLLYIGMDGAVPYAKIIQQRLRRYKVNIMEKYVTELKKKYNISKNKILINSDLWDNINLSPGTEFMNKFSEKLKNAIKENKFCKHLKKIEKQNFKIIFSDSNIPLEGEHKIMNYIRLLNHEKINGQITIYGEDADLIILSLLFLNNIKILRPYKESEKFYYPSARFALKTDYIYFFITNFKLAMIDEFKWKNKNISKIMYDFLFLTLLGGNDFVKPLSYLKINNKSLGCDGLENLIYSYNNITLNKHIYLINNDFTINTNLFKLLINELLINEDKAMKQLYNKKINFEIKNENDKQPWEIDIILFEHSSFKNPKHPFHKEYMKDYTKINFNLNFSIWRNQYYKYFFNNNYNINFICQNYIKSLLFTFYYYLYGIPPSWSWYYPFSVSPLIYDLNNYLQHIKNINILNRFISSKPLLPLQHLFLITNPSHVYILPDSYQKLMLNLPLSKYYPTNFKLDLILGTKYIYSDPILPSLNLNEILPLLSNVKLTSIEQNRNILFIKPYIYIC